MEIHTSLYRDLKQDLPHLSQADRLWVKTKTLCLVLDFKSFLRTKLPIPSGDILITSAPKEEKNLGAPSVTESFTISLLWAQNLRLPFPITYFVLPCAPDEFGKRHTGGLTLFPSGLLLCNLCSFTAVTCLSGRW